MIGDAARLKAQADADLAAAWAAYRDRYAELTDANASALPRAALAAYVAACAAAEEAAAAPSATAYPTPRQRRQRA